MNVFGDKWFALFASVCVVCLTVWAIMRTPEPEQKRAYQVDVDHWNVEFVYGDCHVTEKYEIKHREFKPLFPATTSEKARHRWHVEYGRDPKIVDSLHDLPPSAHIILDEAKPVMPESVE